MAGSSEIAHPLLIPQTLDRLIDEFLLASDYNCIVFTCRLMAVLWSFEGSTSLSWTGFPGANFGMTTFSNGRVER
jgi:hypothetical protein